MTLQHITQGEQLLWLEGRCMEETHPHPPSRSHKQKRRAIQPNIAPTQLTVDNSHSLQRLEANLLNEGLLQMGDNSRNMVHSVTSSPKCLLLNNLKIIFSQEQVDLKALLEASRSQTSGEPYLKIKEKNMIEMKNWLGNFPYTLTGHMS